MHFLAVLGIKIPKSVLLGQSQGVGRAAFLLEALGENLIAAPSFSKGSTGQASLSPLTHQDTEASASSFHF